MGETVQSLLLVRVRFLAELERLEAEKLQFRGACHWTACGWDTRLLLLRLHFSLGAPWAPRSHPGKALYSFEMQSDLGPFKIK